MCLYLTNGERTMLVILMIVCAWDRVVGQFENGIVFSSGPTTRAPAPASTTNPPALLIPDSKCSCILGSACPNQGPTIDIRIVNNGVNTKCPTNYMLCCGGTPNQPTPTDPACGVRRFVQPNPQPVVGQASFGSYPWQAAVLDLQEAYKGSGVLLDATHVLTAAHKVSSYVNNPASLLVRVGDWNARETTEPFKFVQALVAKITVHPNFNPTTLENDVAVIRINGVIPIASYPNVNTACKPTSTPATGTRCYVSGWGKNAFTSGSYQSIMREVDVPILDIYDCENRLRQTRLGPTFTLNKMSFLCAGGEVGKDACTGDGGSPLVCQGNNNQWSVYGLVAWGIGCANPGIPGVYTNVFNFLPWINNALTQ
ncbi:trypsin-like [Copidosoma floridanum]|uniref:trypsin-like n=1 Tax=Copidosoma floridanum TaxID=29053 RepID=UPI0006C9A5AF|nr:trypsin-like [Copidosoma floridanum]